jgi:hypothetical protein
MQYLIKDSVSAILNNRVIIQKAVSNKTDFNKCIKTLEIILPTISSVNFNEILINARGLDNLKKELSAVYLNLNLSNTNIKKEIKNKI